MRQTMSVLAIFIGCVVVPVLGGRALAYDQTTWLSRSGTLGYNAYCSYNAVAGRLNFCHEYQNTSSNDMLNTSQSRDSDLRSSYGGPSDDKYTDNYVVGNLNGGATNTYWVANQFSSAASPVCFYTSTNYTGTTWKTGYYEVLHQFTPSTYGLLSYKSC